MNGLNSLLAFQYKNGYYLWGSKAFANINTLALVRNVTIAPNDTLKRWCVVSRIVLHEPSVYAAPRFLASLVFCEFSILSELQF